MNKSRLESVFKNEVSATYIVRRDLRRFRSRVYKYPYNRLPQIYGFQFNRGKPGKKDVSSSLWHTFIEEIMQRRHRIAHGDTMDNDANVPILISDIEKLDVLMHGILFAAATYLGTQRERP